MGNIIEAANLPEGEKVYLKKDILGWRIVNPIHNQDGSLNWINFLTGGLRNLIFLILILLISAFVMWSYNHDVRAIQSNYANISADPIAWCKDINFNKNSAYPVPNIDINFTTTMDDIG